MSAVTPEVRTRLVKVLSMLNSPHDGERAAAGLLATRIIQSAGTDWDEILKPQHCRGAATLQKHDFSSQPMTDMGLCVRHLRRLSPWEQEFILSLSTRSVLTAGQLRKLAEIAAVLRKTGAR